MKPKQIFKMAINILMTALFLILMGYHITGNHLHEWLGATLFVLFIAHHMGSDSFSDQIAEWLSE